VAVEGDLPDLYHINAYVKNVQAGQTAMTF
jgi:hypothetical protein